MPVPPILERDLALTRGFDFDDSFRWQNPDGTPVNLTGWSARGEVRPEPGDSHLILAFDTDPDAADALGAITLDPAAGRIALHLERERTWQVPRGGAVEVWLFPPGDADPVRFLRGKLTIEPVVVGARPAVSA